MLKKTLIAVVASLLVVAAVPAEAGHDEITKNYIAVYGDFAIVCDSFVGPLGVVAVPLPVNLEDEIGACLGGQIFDELEGGDWEMTVTDEKPDSLGLISGAYRMHDSEGGVTQDNVDTCFDAPVTVPADEDNSALSVWIDGVVWWAQGQPCGAGVIGHGTQGSITIAHK